MYVFKSQSETKKYSRELLFGEVHMYFFLSLSMYISFRGRYLFILLILFECSNNGRDRKCTYIEGGGRPSTHCVRTAYFCTLVSTRLLRMEINVIAAYLNTKIKVIAIKYEIAKSKWQEFVISQTKSFRTRIL